MAVVVIDPPVCPIDLDTVKAHLRVDGDDENDLIQIYLDAAFSHIDGPAGWVQRSLSTQTLEWRTRPLDHRRATADDVLQLPCGPVESIQSFKYLDPDGIEQTLSPDAYILLPSDALVLAEGEAWPSIHAGPESIRIRYVAGYDAVAVPGAIKAAILLLTGDLYANRETAVIGTVSAKIAMSTTIENLLSPYRAWRDTA